MDKQASLRSIAIKGAVTAMLTLMIMSGIFYEVDKIEYSDIPKELPHSSTSTLGVKIESNTGGEEEVITEPKVDQPKIEYPEWSIVPPIVCPAVTQYYYWYHRGIDLINVDCSGNKTLFAVDNGKVIFAEWKGGYGYRIHLEHQNGFITTYSHLSALEVGVGDEVLRGDRIGEMGLTGVTTGLHLHFEIIYQDEKIDPYIYLEKYLR